MDGTGPVLIGVNGYTSNSEIGHIYYELGNLAGGPLTYTDPFLNIQPFLYWTNTISHQVSVQLYSIYDFRFSRGQMAVSRSDFIEYAWAVMDGDVGPAPSPDISITPTSHDFGNVNIGNISTPQTFTISNTGTANLINGTNEITGTNTTSFFIDTGDDSCSAQIIAPLGDCDVAVTFSPDTVGTITASLSVPSNDPDTPTLNVP